MQAAVEVLTALSCSLIQQPAKQQLQGNVTNSFSGLRIIPLQSVLDHVGVSATSSFTTNPLRPSKLHLLPTIAEELLCFRKLELYLSPDALFFFSTRACAFLLGEIFYLCEANCHLNLSLHKQENHNIILLCDAVWSGRIYRCF
jgi:hypothetical protein